MLSQIVLTTTESKKLIAKAVMQMKEVQDALKDGIVVIHPSSTTVFIFQEITGQWPDDVWVFGMVAPEGLCRSKTAVENIQSSGGARKQWVFKNGVLQGAVELNDVLSEMGETDVFIKGCNALDSRGNTAILTSNPVLGGTFGKVLQVQKDRNFKIIIPVGLEKLVPMSVPEMCSKLGTEKAVNGIGLLCGVYHVSGKKVDERDAFSILCGVDAVIASCGGIVGAEGAVTAYIQATEEKTAKLLSVVQLIKGASLPDLEYVTY